MVVPDAAARRMPTAQTLSAGTRALAPARKVASARTLRASTGRHVERLPISARTAKGAKRGGLVGSGRLPKLSPKLIAIKLARRCPPTATAEPATPTPAIRPQMAVAAKTATPPQATSTPVEGLGRWSFSKEGTKDDIRAGTGLPTASPAEASFAG